MYDGLQLAGHFLKRAQLRTMALQGTNTMKLSQQGQYARDQFDPAASNYIQIKLSFFLNPVSGISYEHSPDSDYSFVLLMKAR